MATCAVVCFTAACLPIDSEVHAGLACQVLAADLSEALLQHSLQLQHHASKPAHALELLKLHPCCCKHIPDFYLLQQLQRALRTITKEASQFCH